MTTVNKRETSFEGLVAQLENGEDGVYNLVSENKYTIFQPKKTITKKDIETIPALQEVRQAIDYWSERFKTATGKDRYVIKKALIELRKDQYIIKTAFTVPVQVLKHTRSTHSPEMNDFTHEFDEKGYPIPEGISLLDPQVCEAILCNYSKLKQDSWENFEGDVWYLLIAFDDLSEKALRPFPLYERLVEYKIDGMQNKDIQDAI